LLGLVQDLYNAHKDNQTFLHARFGVGEDALQPYKQTIERWISPDVFNKKQQDISVAKAKQAISDYKKAVGEPAGLGELMVFLATSAKMSATAWGTIWITSLRSSASPAIDYPRITDQPPTDSRWAIREKWLGGRATNSV